jgi:hypothetical protein
MRGRRASIRRRLDRHSRDALERPMVVIPAKTGIHLDLHGDMEASGDLGLRRDDGAGTLRTDEVSKRMRFPWKTF